jgi:hypothetical protein
LEETWPTRARKVPGACNGRSVRGQWWGARRLLVDMEDVGEPTSASEVRRKPWWGEAVGGDVAHTRQEGPWRLQWTLGERAVVGSTTTVGGHGGRRRTH